MEAYRVVFANSVLDFIEERVSSPRVLAKIEAYQELLAQYPGLGAVYDPDYPAARPPITCRRLPVPETPFSLYYAVDEDERVVKVFFIEFARADSLRRFGYAGLY